jgi:hypothetical protein
MNIIIHDSNGASRRPDLVARHQDAQSQVYMGSQSSVEHVSAVSTCTPGSS